MKKNLFEKGYTQKWSTEIFCIDSQVPSNPPTYIIKKLADIDYNLKKFYYTEELQKVNNIEFPYDSFEVIDKNRNKIKVKQLNDEEQKETWIEKKQYNLRSSVKK